MIYSNPVFPCGQYYCLAPEDLTEICAYARSFFSRVERITVYGFSRYIHSNKGLTDLIKLKERGLSRIHVGLESADEEVLKRIKKGTNTAEVIEAGLWVREVGIALSEYIIPGIGGKERSRFHGLETAWVLNAINPDFVRLRTFIPKINTLLLHQIRKGQFQLLSAHEVLKETQQIMELLRVTSMIFSDHYTNYLNLYGRMPYERGNMFKIIGQALQRDERALRPIYVRTQYMKESHTQACKYPPNPFFLTVERF